MKASTTQASRRRSVLIALTVGGAAGFYAHMRARRVMATSLVITAVGLPTFGVAYAIEQLARHQLGRSPSFHKKDG